MIIVIIMSSSSLSFLAAAGATQAVVSYWIYVHSVHCFRAHFAPQNTRHVVQKVVMPFQSAPKSFQWVYFASYWRSKHLQCHNLRLRLYSYTFLIFSPSISIHLHRMPPGLESKESKESEVPKARRASRRPDGRDETKAMNLQRFCDAQRETWPMGSRVVQTLRIKMLLVFQFFSNAFLCKDRESIWCFDLHSIYVLYVQIQRGLTEIIQNLSMPLSLSLSLSIMNEWFHPCILFVFASCQRDVCALKLTTFYAGSIHQRLSDSTARAEDTFDRALQEICQGRKSSCWILDSLQLCMLRVFFLILGRSGWGDPVFHGFMALMGS